MPATVVKLNQIYQIFFFTLSLWNQQNFRSSHFWLNLIAWSVSTLRQHICKIRCRQKSIRLGVHSYYNLNIKIFKWKVKINAVLWWCVLNRRCFPDFTVWLLLWCFQIVFWNDLGVKNRSSFNFYKKKTAWQFDVRSHMTQDLGDTRLF